MHWVSISGVKSTRVVILWKMRLKETLQKTKRSFVQREKTLLQKYPWLYQGLLIQPSHWSFNEAWRKNGRKLEKTLQLKRSTTTKLQQSTTTWQQWEIQTPNIFWQLSVWVTHTLPRINLGKYDCLFPFVQSIVSIWMIWKKTAFFMKLFFVQIFFAGFPFQKVTYSFMQETSQGTD